MSRPRVGICWTRSSAVLTSSLLAVGLLVTWAAPVLGVNWRSVNPTEEVGREDIYVSGQEYRYYSLDAREPTVLQVRGPRRLKIVSRYLFGTADPEEQNYVIQVLVDGREVLRKSFRSAMKDNISLPSDPATAVAALRKWYVDLSTGMHTIQVLGTTEGDGRIAARFFRESRLDKTVLVPYAPEKFDDVYQLQFASGTQSTYYHFDIDQPLVFTVSGPTNLKIYTRLDFDHLMNGSQAYALEVYCDMELHQTFHYHTKKLTTVTYVERSDILPGSRKIMRLTVPKGKHRYEIRCVRPERCGITAQIRIPQADINSD